MNSPEVKQFIKEHSNLFWYTPEDKKQDISHEFLVEHIFNYGSWEAVKKMFDVLGLEYTLQVFYHSINISERRRGNYFPQVLNYFLLLYKRYVQRDSD